MCVGFLAMDFRDSHGVGRLGVDYSGCKPDFVRLTIRVEVDGGGAAFSRLARDVLIFSGANYG